MTRPYVSRHDMTIVLSVGQKVDTGMAVARQLGLPNPHAG